MRSIRDVVLLFATRSLRMFGYGFLAVVLVLYLEALGFDGAAVGLLLGADAARRRGDLAAADDPGGPVRPAADAVPRIAA